MKILCAFLAAVLLVGCSGAHKKGISRYDEYDAVKIDQMVGNDISHAVFEKTIVCLNARRESRRVSAVTNVNVLTVTNHTVTAVTNATISIATNYLVTTMTNLAPQIAAAPPAQPGTDATAAPAETNTVLTPVHQGPAITTNLTISLANNASATAAPSQTAANNQFVRTYNNQITTALSNLTVSLMTNLVVTAETNSVVSYVTNFTVGNVTNTVITPTNFLARDYFLYTEMIPPADFTLQTGESLVLLVDGVRYGFTPGQSGTAFVSRKRFTSGLYKAQPEVLVAIANAKEVKIRFKGVNSVIERTMSDSSKQNFKTFLLKHFTPEPTNVPARKMADATPASAEAISN